MIKEIILCAALTSLFLFSACDDPNDNSAGADWYVGTTHYDVSSVSRTATNTTHSIIAEDNNNSLVIFFASFPTTTGYYKLVAEQKAGLNQLGPNECAMMINIGTLNAYLSLGIENDSVYIDVRDDKINANYSNVFGKFEHINNTNASVIDTVDCGKGVLNEE